MTGWSLLLRISRTIDAINRILGRAMVWPILAAVLVSAGNAMSRKFFDISSNAFLEVQWYLFSLAFLGVAGYVLLVDEHVRIDAFSQKFSERTRAWIDIVVLAGFILPLTLLMGYLGFKFFWTAWVTGEMSSNAGGLPRWPVYFCLPLGMAALGLQAISELIRRAAWMSGKTERRTLSESDLPAFMPDKGGVAS